MDLKSIFVIGSMFVPSLLIANPCDAAKETLEEGINVHIQAEGVALVNTNQTFVEDLSFKAIFKVTGDCQTVSNSSGEILSYSLPISSKATLFQNYEFFAALTDTAFVNVFFDKETNQLTQLAFRGNMIRVHRLPVYRLMDSFLTSFDGDHFVILIGPTMVPSKTSAESYLGVGTIPDNGHAFEIFVQNIKLSL
jgi:hypothetical protein